MAEKTGESSEPAADIKPEAEKASAAASAVEVLARESDPAEPTTDGVAKSIPIAPKSSRTLPAKFRRLLNRYWSKKRWTLPATVLVLILIILIIPFTRYASLGLFVKGSVTVSLVDSATNTPVSSAAVAIGGHTVYTNADGKVISKVKLGSRTLTITKQYYKTANEHVTVTFSKQHNTFTYHLVANGRQVPITILNKITGKPIAGAEITVASSKSTTSKSDKNGKATIVLPTKPTSQKVSVTGAGYNTLQATIQVTGKDIAANHFSLTPSGKLYFLSNQSGKIDVVKTNLDGTDRQTVLAGTGHEEPYSTSLLASRDWKYLALLSTRTAGDTAISLINTSNDKITDIDDSKTASFSLIGWDNDTFVYTVSRSEVNNWQSGAVSLKSYDASSGKLNVLDTTKATGTSNLDAKYEALFSTGVYIVGDTVVYEKLWYAYPGYLNVPGQQNTLTAIQADGSNKKVLASVDAATAYFGNLFLYSPRELLIQQTNTDNSPSSYYKYDATGKFAKDTDNEDIADLTNALVNTYPTHLLSPSGKQTFWSDERDGRNALFVGDGDAENQKQIATLSDYQTYGWFTDSYLLVSKNSSELYIMAADGSTPPQKISDYYRPPITYRGYGGGYGGI